MSMLKAAWIVMTNFKSILITIVVYSVTCFYSLIISFSDTANFYARVDFGTVALTLIMFSPVLFIWIKTSIKDIMKRFNFVDWLPLSIFLSNLIKTKNYNWNYIVFHCNRIKKIPTKRFWYSNKRHNCYWHCNANVANLI